MNSKIILVIIAIGILLVVYLLFNTNKTKNDPIPRLSQNPNTVRFVAVGDSYTIGLDVSEDEAWPSLLIKHLQEEGVQIELIDNLAVTGYTADEIITQMLPRFENLDPEFATILVGANDISLGIDSQTYRRQFVEIIETMLSKLVNKSHLVILTIPDFTKTPRGRVDFSDEQYSKAVESFNEVIKMEAKKRNLTVVDLQDINEGISTDNAFYTIDGLHPSAKQYQLWEKRIYPKVKEILVYKKK